MKNIKLIATDLDGTFLKDDQTISIKNLKALHNLGDAEIVRVAATGRNLHKAEQVLNKHIPFDFIVFSSGAGVFDWKNKKHIYNKNIEKKSSKKLINYFIEKKLNFHAFFPVPENHKHWYFRGEKHCEEFERYFQFNNAFASEIKPNKIPDTNLCQFLIIIPEDKKEFEKLKNSIEAISPEIRVIRTSSPITKGYIWIEIFQKSVSKGNGVKHICDLLNIKYTNTIGIGNDYNDIDLLDFTGHSFITENAPAEINKLYKSAPSNENDAFAFITRALIINSL
jgi:Cof subfamily protein (haloacid dehalogenase superfamily)